MTTAPVETSVFNPQHFEIRQSIRRRLRIVAPSLRKNPERGYVLDILLRKREGIADVKLQPEIGSVVVYHDPEKLTRETLLKLLDALIPGLGQSQFKKKQAIAFDPDREFQDIQFAVEGMTCASCALLLEMKLNRQPGVNRASVNLASESGFVNSSLTREELFGIVESLGYRALPLNNLLQRKQVMEREKLRLKESRQRAIGAMLLSVPVTIVAMAELQGSFWRWMQFLLSIPIVFWSGKPFFTKAVKLAKQRTANMDSLIVLGVGSAWVYSTAAMFWRRPYLYFDAAAGIICFVLLGRYLEEKAKGQAHEAINRLLDLQPQTANLLRDGKEFKVGVEELIKDDLILIRPGDKIPTDGVVIEGTSTVDEAMMTGESLPVIKNPGDIVVGGCINGNGVLTVSVSATGADTVLSGIIRMVDQAQSSKLPIQKTVDQISRVFVPSVMAIATLTFGGWMLAGAGFTTAFATGITVLLIACPCALGLATPAAIMVGTGQAAKKGIYIRNGESLEQAAHLNVLIFDKTGTITEGKPKVTDFFKKSRLSEDKILAIMATAEWQSEHFLAKAMVAFASERGIEPLKAEEFEAIPGRGVRARVEGHQILLGNANWLKDTGINLQALEEMTEILSGEGKTLVFLAIDGKAAALFGIADQPRENAKDAIAVLKKLGLETMMVTGDIESAARNIAEKVGISQIVAEARPERKLEIVRELQNRGLKVGMIGDGINDAPALAAADVGFAIGTGTDIAIETADLTLINGDIGKVAEGIKLSSDTLKIVRQNLFWAFGYNTLAIPVAAVGKLNPMIASMTMALSSISVVMNSLRLQRKGK